MPEDAIWPIEPHTRAKHELLRRYLGAWFPILASRGFNRRVLFLDGFAGPGVYEGGEAGSPIIALQTLVDHPHFSKWSGTEFSFLFVESVEDRHASLEAAIESFWENMPSGKPANVRVSSVYGEFADVADQIVQNLEEQKKRLAPTFAFIDPFGWSGVPLTLIGELLSFPKCEVLFNFMVDSVNRFVEDERPGIAVHFTDLFGSDEQEHMQAAGLSGDDRKLFLSELYLRQLRSVAGFKFTRRFEMVNVERGRTAYYLMFGTRHPKGLAVMKDAMWALDPEAGARFAGTAGDQSMLFEPQPDFASLERAILEEFGGQTVSVDGIEDFVIEDTDYKATHYKKQVLQPLEKAEQLECISGRSRRFTYPKGTLLRFT